MVSHARNALSYSRDFAGTHGAPLRTQELDELASRRHRRRASEEERVMATEYTYKVYGTGRFPIDELRYEWARPASQADSRAIELSLFGGGGAAPGTVVRIVGLNPPSARWRSFGWLVGDVEKRKVQL